MTPIRRTVANLATAVLSASAAFVVLIPAPIDCTPVTSGTDAQWAALMDAGWHGDSRDSMEALYSPTCPTH